MTVKEAAMKVLEASNRPLDGDEILSEIKRQDFYQFRAKGARGIVMATLKRHAENAHSCTPAKVKVFRQIHDGSYELLGQ